MSEPLFSSLPSWRHWRALLLPGDWLVLFLACSLAAVSFPLLWQGGGSDRVLIHQNGQLFSTVDLKQSRDIIVPGPLGETHIRIEPGRARVVSDPGPRQYCVRQGWLKRAGEIAICAPNRVSLTIAGRTRLYDSISY